MGGFLTSTFVRSNDHDLILRAAAAERLPFAYVGPATDGWVGIYHDGGDPEALAQSLSERLGTVAISFSVYDGDFLEYWLAREGRLIDRFHSRPGYFGETVSAAERKHLRGNADVLAEACGRPDAAARVAPLLADPPSDAFGLLDELGEWLSIPGATLSYNDLADPGRRTDVPGWEQYQALPEGARQAAPPPKRSASTPDFLEWIQAQVATEEAAEARRRARLEKTRDPVFGVDYPGIHPNVVGSLVTFADLTTPEGRRRLIDAFLHVRTVLGPLVPRGFPLQWEYIYPYRGSLSSKSPRSGKKKDTEVLKLLETEEIRSVSLEAEQQGPWAVAFEMTPLRPGWPITFTFSFDPKCASPDGRVTAEWQTRTVDLLLELTQRLDAACGFLTLETMNISPSTVGTPYEYLVNTLGDQQFPLLATRFRGYFWGNILGPGQIEGLGGLDAVLAGAPCPVRPFPGPEGPWVYLQVSPDINQYSDDQLRRLRDYLAPILPTGERLYPQAYGRLVLD